MESKEALRPHTPTHGSNWTSSVRRQGVGSLWAGCCVPGVSPHLSEGQFLFGVWIKEMRRAPLGLASAPVWPWPEGGSIASTLVLVLSLWWALAPRTPPDRTWR